MNSLKSQVGLSSGPYRDEITLLRIAEFCKAVGIRENGVAPPTFLTIFRKGEFDLFQKLGIVLANVLHTEQEYLYENSIQAGDCVEFQTVVAHVLEKQTRGAQSVLIQFITFETQFYTEKNAVKLPVGKSKTMIVVRTGVPAPEIEKEGL